MSVMRDLRNLALRALRYLFSERVEKRLMPYFSKRLIHQLRDVATDDFLETLLYAMEAAFCLCPDYRRNLDGLDARYVFRTGEGAVGATAEFRGGHMHTSNREAHEGWKTCVTFNDAAALRDFLFSKDQDILSSILTNAVHVDGNLNYVYRFGYLARDLERRLLAF
jgi:hypothetical protein